MKWDDTAHECGIVIRHIEGRPRDIDACIAPIVDALNAAGLTTVCCCCGHGRRPGEVSLADGRSLLVMPEEEVRRIDRLWQPKYDNPDVPQPPQLMLVPVKP